jgi:uncharacterized damage-inducible protein DinB
MTSVLLELVRHKTWATRKFIELCQSLDTALVDATSPGTYGTIRQTLVHLVNADRNYFRRISGEEPWDKMTSRLPTCRRSPLSISRLRRTGNRWRRTLRSPIVFSSTPLPVSRLRHPGLCRKAKRRLQ